MSSHYKNLENFAMLHGQKGLKDKVYNALLKDDPSEAVIAALYILKKTAMIPKLSKTIKGNELSSSYRSSGNESFRAGDYTRALCFYNLALCSSIKDSECMLFAYSNRSALFQKVKVYSAALKDIETCLAMKCPPQIEEKLKLRREECLRMVSAESSHKKKLENGFGNKFNDSFEQHPHIPCVSTFVDIGVENDNCKIVAAKYIPVGTIVSIETPFVSNVDSDNICYACHYCHKFTFNLIPCDNCCETLFCSEICKETCNNEYHHIECCMMDLLTNYLPDHCYRIALKAALKMKTMSESWDKFISSTSTLTKTKPNSLKEWYDAKNIQSILNFKVIVDTFVYGQKYNNSFATAIIIYHLEKIHGFFPVNQDLKLKTIQAFGRILIHMISLKHSLTKIQNAVLTYPKMELSQEPEADVGLFSFTSKLRHDCDANLFVLGLQNKVALVAIKPIQKGSELTISYVGHWLDRNYKNLRANMMIFVKPGCQCRICLGKWCSDSTVDGIPVLNQSQKAFYLNWFKLIMTEADPETIFYQTCRGLEIFEVYPNTNQYQALYNHFRMVLSQWQCLITGNGYLKNH